MTTPYRIVLCTWPADRSPLELASRLVESGLAACVNVVPGITSLYRWQDRVEQDGEQLLLIKTRKDAIPGLQQAILHAHPYELPEIVAVAIESGLEGYLDWMEKNIK